MTLGWLVAKALERAGAVRDANHLDVRHPGENREISDEERLLAFALEANPCLPQEIQDLTVESFASNPVEATHCYLIARELFNLISQMPLNDREPFGTAGSYADVVASLRDNVERSIEKEEAVFYVKYGKHGFLVVTRRGSVEVLQSFNGRYTIASSLAHGRPYLPSDFDSLLRKLAAGGIEAARARSVLFWCNETLECADNTAWYDKGVLRSDEEMAARLDDRIRKNVAYYKVRVPWTAPCASVVVASLREFDR